MEWDNALTKSWQEALLPLQMWAADKKSPRTALSCPFPTFSSSGSTGRAGGWVWVHLPNPSDLYWELLPSGIWYGLIKSIKSMGGAKNQCSLKLLWFGADFRWWIFLGVGREIVDKAVNCWKFELRERSVAEQLVINMFAKTGTKRCTL